MSESGKTDQDVFVYATTRLPVAIYSWVSKWAQREGIVTSSGRANMSRALEQLAVAGMRAVDQQSMRAVRDDAA